MATLLTEMLAELNADSTGTESERQSVRQLLVRAYFHSAQLGRAEATAQAQLAADPTDVYITLLLTRVLERQSRPTEAAEMRRIAHALGAPDST